MVKASGKTRNSAPARVQAATERGYSKQLEREILSMENSIRRNRDESAYFYGDNGEIVEMHQGKGTQIRLPYKGST